MLIGLCAEKSIAILRAAEKSNLLPVDGVTVTSLEDDDEVEQRINLELARIKEQFDLYKAETSNLIEEMECQRQMIILLDDENKRRKDTIADLEEVSRGPR